MQGNVKNKDMMYKRKLSGSLPLRSLRVALAATIEKFNLERRYREEILKSNEQVAYEVKLTTVSANVFRDRGEEKQVPEGR
jgi:putative hemolysin